MSAAGVLAYLLVGQNLEGDGTAGSRIAEPGTAAIVDHLSLTQPNPAFAETATDLLEEAGYTVDYYPGEEVTVDFWRNLPTHGYGLLILRVHSGLARDDDKPTDYVSLFTAEPFSDTKHYEDAEAERLARARYYEGGSEYFAIVPDFIESSMAGTFDGTTIIVMGCDGLATSAAAEAFVHRGAEAVVGWDGPVSAEHTDAATERLLQHLLLDELTIPEAVAQTMAELGPDPLYGATLLVHPSEG